MAPRWQCLPQLRVSDYCPFFFLLLDIFCNVFYRCKFTFQIYIYFLYVRLNRLNLCHKGEVSSLIFEVRRGRTSRYWLLCPQFDGVRLFLEVCLLCCSALLHNLVKGYISHIRQLNTVLLMRRSLATESLTPLYFRSPVVRKHWLQSEVSLFPLRLRQFMKM